jgi:hypothetical protein
MKSPTFSSLPVKLTAHAAFPTADCTEIRFEIRFLQAPPPKISFGELAADLLITQPRKVYEHTDESTFRKRYSQGCKL